MLCARNCFLARPAQHRLMCPESRLFGFRAFVVNDHLLSFPGKVGLCVFTGIFLTSGLYCSQAECRPA